MDVIGDKSSQVELCEGENMITSVKYGTTKVGNEAADHYIHITDKRIVLIDTAKDHVVRDEIFVDDIAQVHGGIKKVRYAALAVFGLIFLVLGIVLATQTESLSVIPCIVCIVIGIVLLVLYYLLGAKSFVLSIDCKCLFNNAVSIGISTIVAKRRKRAKTVKVKVDVSAADSILSSIGKVVAAKH